MAKDNTDFLRFSAYSIKDLITRKLSEDSKFTDQIYEGSNLAILIDLVSYMYQCLVYQLNNAAAESMFADTQIFENIQRLVNLIGYQVKGCYPSTIKTYVKHGDQNNNVKCFPYTRFDTGKTDSLGNKVYFSTARTASDREGPDMDVDEYKNITFYNGQYKAYPTVFTASGTANETFVLDVMSDSDQQKYVANDFIDVYVETGGELDTGWTYDSNGIFLDRSSDTSQLNIDNSFYGNGSSNSDKTSKVYTVYLNQDRKYEVKFGDGIVGQRLNAGDRVIIMYLDTNGPDGEVDVADIDFTSIALEHSAESLGISESMYEQMFDLGSSTSITELTSCEVSPNVDSASDFVPEQSVSDVRTAAPNYFKMGNRLITNRDYEYYIKNSSNARSAFGYDIADVKCMNNTEFVGTFYKWLYQQGLLNGLTNGGRHYFDQTFWNRTGYTQIDPADCNNTYVWIKSNNPSQGYVQDEYASNIANIESELNDLIKPIKTMTTGLQVVPPVLVNFDICANSDLSAVRGRYMTDDVNFDSGVESYVEITLDDNTMYVSTSIQAQVESIILDAFNINKCALGQNVTYGSMLDQIYALAGVKNVRTVCKVNGSVYRTYDGISFASWSPILNDSEMTGVDLVVGNTSRQLEEFQFPVFIGGTLLRSRIKVIKKSLTAINTIKS